MPVGKLVIDTPDVLFAAYKEINIDHTSALYSIVKGNRLVLQTTV